MNEALFDGMTAGIRCPRTARNATESRCSPQERGRAWESPRRALVSSLAVALAPFFGRLLMMTLAAALGASFAAVLTLSLAASLRTTLGVTLGMSLAVSLGVILGPESPETQLDCPSADS